MKRTIVFGSVGVMALLVAAAALASDKTKSEQAFDHLASLQGEWQGIADGVNTTLIDTLTANGLTATEDLPTTGLTLIDEDHDRLTQEWAYQHKGKTGKNIFRFTRVRQAAS